MGTWKPFLRKRSFGKGSKWENDVRFLQQPCTQRQIGNALAAGGAGVVALIRGLRPAYLRMLPMRCLMLYTDLTPRLH